MGHKHETQALSESMASHEHVFRRGATWYYRRRIPEDLLAAGVYGKRKEYKESLKTANLRDANEAASRRDVMRNAEFEQKRRDLSGKAKDGQDTKPKRERPLTSLSGIERKELVLKWFVLEEQEAERTRRKYSDSDPALAAGREQLIGNLIDDLTALGSFHGTDFWEHSFKGWLKEQGLKFEPGEAAEELENWLKRARVETAKRTLQHLQGKPSVEIDGFFAGLSSLSEQSLSSNSGPRVTLGELCKKFMEGKRGEKTRASTLKSYNLPIQVLNDLFGPTRPITSFEYSDGERVIEFLKRVPVHADKHYPGKSLVEAATAESPTPARSRPR